MERSAAEGTEKAGLLTPLPACCTAVPHSRPEPCPLCVALPHIPREWVFPKVTIHTQDGTSCAVSPLLHCTAVSGEMKIKTTVFTLSPLNREGECFSSDGRELGARDGLRFKTNPRRQFCRRLKLLESQILLCSEQLNNFPSGLALRVGGMLWTLEGTANPHLISSIGFLSETM